MSRPIDRPEHQRWKMPPELWRTIKPLAREMRTQPTMAENILWQRVRREQVLGYKFRRQHAIERFIVDFYCAQARLVIEVDGPTHDRTPAYDALRTEFLNVLGLTVLRFSNEEVITQTHAVIEVIVEHLQHIESDRGD